MDAREITFHAIGSGPAPPAAHALSPLRWVNDITYGVFRRGAAVHDWLSPIVAMSGLGARFCASGTLWFRTRPNAGPQDGQRTTPLAAG
jgi:hypothetical protein